MSVIGVGKAARDQARAAAATRSRGDRGGRFEASEALPRVIGRSPCASCGVEHDRAQLVFAEQGAVCMNCEADAELEGLARPGTMGWVMDAMVPAPALLCALLLTLPWWFGSPPSGKAGAFWAIASAVALTFAMMGGLTGARSVATARQQPVDHPSRSAPWSEASCSPWGAGD